MKTLFHFEIRQLTNENPGKIVQTQVIKGGWNHSHLVLGCYFDFLDKNGFPLICLWVLEGDIVYLFANLYIDEMNCALSSNVVNSIVTTCVQAAKFIMAVYIGER